MDDRWRRERLKAFWFDERVFEEAHGGTTVRCPKKHRTHGSAWRCGVRWLRNNTSPERREDTMPVFISLRFYRYDPATGTYK
jgi:hypothetical protein